jgi:hypothetical protein
LSLAGVAQTVERLPCKQQVGGSNPFASSSSGKRARASVSPVERSSVPASGPIPESSRSMARYPSGQRGQTVNLLANAFGGSNPPLATSGGSGFDVEIGDRGRSTPRGSTSKPDPMICGNSSAVERQPSKLGVAGSNPVSRSRHSGAGCVAERPPRRATATARFGSMSGAHVAQSVEHVLGKDGVTGSSPVMGSIFSVCGAR